VQGLVTFTPSVPVQSLPADIAPSGFEQALVNGTFQTTLMATDGLGFYWTLTVTTLGAQVPPNNFYLSFGNGSTQSYNSLGPVGTPANALLVANNLADVSSPATALANIGGATPAYADASSASAVATETTRALVAEAAIGDIRPQDVGVIGWTAFPASTANTTAYTPGTYGGRLLLFMFRVPVAGTINRINYSVDVIGSVISNSYMGIYSMSGSLLGQCTTDQSANLTVGVNSKIAALSSPLAVSPGLYRVGWVTGSATTQATLMSLGGQNSGAFTNLGLSTANLVVAYYGSLNTYTALPASYIPNNCASLAAMPIFVMS
jgi:hypothetical protein